MMHGSRLTIKRFLVLFPVLVAMCLTSTAYADVPLESLSHQSQYGSASPAAPVQSPQTISDGLYSIVSALDPNMVLDISGASQENGGNLQLYSYNGTGAQKFWVKRDNAGCYTITSFSSGKMIDLSGGCLDLRTNIQQWEANSTESQQWAIQANEGGHTIASVKSGMLLDVTNAAAVNGANIQAFEGNGTSAQLFRFVSACPVADGDYTIVHSATGFVVDVAGGSTANGANAQLYSSNDTPAQKWSMRSMGVNGAVSGFDAVSFMSALAPIALDVESAGNTPGTNLQLWGFAGVAAQRFRAIPSGDGHYFLQSECGGQYVTAAGFTEGANLYLDRPAGTDAQKFDFTPTSLTRTIAQLQADLSSADGGGLLTSFGNFSLPEAQYQRVANAIAAIHRTGYGVGFMMQDLTTGKGISYNADGVFYSASTLKGPYVASLACKNPGSLRSRGAMDATIRWSSNDDYARLRQMYGNDTMYAWCAEAGVPSQLASQKYMNLSVRNLAKLWLRNYEFFTSGDPNAGISDMYTTPNQSVIHSQLGRAYRTWSKAGWYYGGNSKATADAGVVWSGSGPYLVAIMSNIPGNFNMLSELMWSIEDSHNTM